MTIKTKLFLSALLTLFLFFTIVVSGLLGNRAMEQTISTARAFEQEQTYLQMLFRGINESLLTEGTQDSIELGNLGFAGFEITHRKLLSQDINIDIKHILSTRVDQQWQLVKVKVSQFLELNTVYMSDQKLMAEYGKLLLFGELLTKEIKSLADRSQVLAESTARTTQYISFIVVSIILLVMCVLFINIFISIIKPIKILQDATFSITHGNLDQKIEIDIKNEFGQLADSFNKMNDNLNITTVSRDKLVDEVERRRISEKKAEHLAFHDHLTGLPNRHLLMDRINQTIKRARRQNKLAALVFIDLDRFKLVNDSFGHAVGDSLIKSVAKRLRENIRNSDTLTRHGGDEFTILIPDLTTVKHITKIIKVIFAVFEAPFNIEGQHLIVTTSIGVSIFPNDGEDAGTLLKNADTAMYYAKDERINSYRLFTKQMNDFAVARLDLEHRLHKAMKNEEFILFYQPQFDITTGNVIGVEALVRWKEPPKRLIPPDDFIPLAEDTGLIISLGEWILHEACAQNKMWQDKGMKPIIVAVNISTLQFIQKDFISMITSILETTKLDPKYLELELTETVLMEDIDTTLETLHELKRIGIRLSIDDFGTGYSSLVYIKKMPINMLKIAQEFVRDIHVDSSDITITKSIIDMAHNLGLEVIAEGVETKEHLKILTGLNCKKVQGYFLSRPLPSEEFEVFIENYKQMKKDWFT